MGLAICRPTSAPAGALLCCLSWLCLIAAVPAIYILCVRLDLGPREKLVDGQRHLTLTGWDRKDYSILKLIPDVRFSRWPTRT